MTSKIKFYKISDWPYWMKAFAINFVIAAISIVPFIVWGEGNFALSNDFIAESIPFGMFINNAYKSGEVIWNFNIDLGSNFLEALYGYNSSPFVILQLLFPAELYPKIIGWIIILKYAMAGMTSSLYIRKYIKKENILLVGTMLYTFSSYNCSTIVFQFQDVVAIFPLMLYTLEILVENNKMIPFILATFLSGLVGFTNLVVTALFIIIYYIVKYLVPELKNYERGSTWIKKSLQCLVGGVIGFFLSGIFTLPVIVNLFGNNRAASKLSFSNWFSISTADWLLNIKAFFLPAEPMNHSFSITSSDWMSNYAYIPIFGCSLVIVYLYSVKGSDWLRKIITLFILFVLFPIFNNSFYLFSSSPYRRWYHMLVLLMVLATTKILESPKEYDVQKGIKISIVTIVLFLLICTFISYSGKFGILLINDRKWFFYNIFYSLIGLGFTILIFSKGLENKLNYINVISITGVFCILQLGITINQYQSYADNTGKDFWAFDSSYSKAAVDHLTNVADKLDEDIGPYRYYFDEGIGYTYYNIGMTNNLPTINSFISTLSNSITDFYDELGVGRGTMTIRGPEGTLSLLSVKYVISEGGYYDYPIIEQIQNENDQIFNIIENPYALPLGIVYDSYMKKSEFDNIENDKRAIAMLHSLVVDDQDEYKVVDQLEHYSCSNADELNVDSLKQLIEEKQSVSCGSFTKAKNSFTSEIESNGNNYIFYSIPYEKWWRATVNGEPADILNINGLMAVEIKDGNNKVLFEYDYAPFKIGLVMTVSGVFFTLIIAIYEQKNILIIKKYHKASFL